MTARAMRCMQSSKASTKRMSQDGSDGIPVSANLSFTEMLSSALKVSDGCKRLCPRYSTVCAALLLQRMHIALQMCMHTGRSCIAFAAQLVSAVGLSVSAKR